MEHWYNINLKQPGYLGDEDYQNYVLLFKYVDKVDVSLMNPPYHSISALFNSQEHAEKFCRENGEFVQSISTSIDREILTKRTFMLKDVTTEEKDKDVHTEHCCYNHGCKYGHKDCPVELGLKKQSHDCEECGLEKSGYYD